MLQNTLTITQWKFNILQFEDKYHLQIFFFSISSRSALKSTQLRIRWLTKKLFPGIKRSRHEADLSHSSSVEAKKAWNYTSTHPYVSKVWKGINLPFTHGKVHIYPFLSLISCYILVWQIIHTYFKYTYP